MNAGQMVEDEGFAITVNQMFSSMAALAVLSLPLKNFTPSSELLTQIKTVETHFSSPPDTKAEMISNSEERQWLVPASYIFRYCSIDKELQRLCESSATVKYPHL